MTFQRKISTLLIVNFILFLLVTTPTYSQEYTLDSQNSSLIVYGTSNIHDWDLKTENKNGTISLDTENNLQINSLKIVVEAESLKSGKGGMDKNTYKALNTDDYKTIEFVLISVDKITGVDKSNFNVTSKGDLTISGVTKRITLNFTLNLNNDVVKLIGEKSLKMTDFKIDPPRALLGTIRTGDEVTIKFNTILQRN